jgi:hypothetical protein
MFQNGFYKNLFKKSLFVGIILCFLFFYTLYLTPPRENVDFQAVPVILAYRVLQ